MKRLVFVLLGLALMAAPAKAYTIPASGDPGGNVGEYLDKYEQLRQSGEQVQVDGPCLSACTLVTRLPIQQVCVTSRAVFGFHSPSYGINDDYGHLVGYEAAPEKNYLMMRLYPPAIRRMIRQHGGLKPRLLRVHASQLPIRYQTCGF